MQVQVDLLRGRKYSSRVVSKFVHLGTRNSGLSCRGIDVSSGGGDVGDTVGTCESVPSWHPEAEGGRLRFNGMDKQGGSLQEQGRICLPVHIVSISQVVNSRTSVHIQSLGMILFRHQHGDKRRVIDINVHTIQCEMK